MTRIPTPSALLACAALAAVAPLPAGAQGPDRAAFVVRRGADTLAAESWTRQAGRVEGELRGRNGPAVAYSWTTGEGATVGAITVRVTVPGQGTQGVEATFRGDGAELRVLPGGAAPPRRVAARRGTVPFLNLSTAVLEQAVLRARALGGDSAAVPLLDPLSGRGFEAAVRGAAGGEATLVVAGVGLRLALDPRGRVLGGWVPAQGVIFERTSPAGGRLPAGAAEVIRTTAARPDYSAPAGAPYTAQEVRVPVGAGLALGGTLTLPQGRSGPTPVVVLVSGSGPQDRDAAMPVVPGYRLFRQIADTLGRRGVAVLRLDDRGVGASGAGPQGATTADLAGDLRAVVAWLRTRPEVDGARIALAGHSEGALIAAMTAADDPAVRAVVLLAGQSRPGRELNLEQNRRVVEAAPGLPRAQRDSTLARVPAQVDSLAAANPWFRFWLGHDPRPVLRRLRQPVLVMHGAADWQVPPEQGEEAGATLRAAGNTDVTVRVLPGVNHLFLADPRPVPTVEYYAGLPSKQAPSRVLAVLADWLVERLGR